MEATPQLSPPGAPHFCAVVSSCKMSTRLPTQHSQRLIYNTTALRADLALSLAHLKRFGSAMHVAAGKQIGQLALDAILARLEPMPQPWRAVSTLLESIFSADRSWAPSRMPAPVLFHRLGDACPDQNEQVLSLAVNEWTLSPLARARATWNQRVVQLLSRLLPRTKKHDRPRVLVPGAGVGRLAFEIARHGYHVTAIECHPASLALTDFLLNDGPGLCLNAFNAGASAPLCSGSMEVIEGCKSCQRSRMR